MTSVIDHNDNVIELRNCSCGAEPEYKSANGLAHVIACPSCLATTTVERCGIDAVTKWNGKS